MDKTIEFVCDIQDCRNAGVWMLSGGVVVCEMHKEQT